MPLREFLYSAEEYAKWINRNKKDLFGEKLVQVPAPKCFELYNGKTNEPDRFEKRLSEAFMHPAPGYEWTVYVININAGHNKKIMDKCEPLKAYSVFVQRVRDNIDAGMELRKAIEEAVDYCIKCELMAEYFAENRGSVVDMVWNEYNAKIHEENLKEEGRKEGREEGESRMSRLMAYLLKDGKSEEAFEATKSKVLREELYKRYGIA